MSGPQRIATIAGPALGGLLVTSAGPGWALAANAASYVIAAVLQLGTVAAADEAGSAVANPLPSLRLR